mmetsp:Transcript_38547/g.89905  ORF Transcript_38547/g.89905 Transcript_38547/m.89905 type:complete len:201 (+) Transcript_38547:232-834(+)
MRSHTRSPCTPSFAWTWRLSCIAVRAFSAPSSPSLCPSRAPPSDRMMLFSKSLVICESVSSFSRSKSRSRASNSSTSTSLLLAFSSSFFILRSSFCFAVLIRCAFLSPPAAAAPSSSSESESGSDASSLPKSNHGRVASTLRRFLSSSIRFLARVRSLSSISPSCTFDHRRSNSSSILLLVSTRSLSSRSTRSSHRMLCV